MLPGDVILTGSPPGFGSMRNPPEYLKPGDIIESEIECLGKICNRVVKVEMEDCVPKQEVLRKCA